MNGEIDLSLSELRSLVTKAARGAGMSWGLAEEAGWAAEWLARRGMPAAPWATAWLQDRLNGLQDPIETGVSVGDRKGVEPIPDGLAAPGYLLPFLHLVAEQTGAVTLHTPDGEAARIAPSGEVCFGPCWADRTRGWTITLTETRAAASRPTVDASVIECLEGLALGTTVPPSDQSRRDAGSAKDDND
jgi:hypothetical protein